MRRIGQVAVGWRLWMRSLGQPALTLGLHAAPLDGGIVQSVLLGLCALFAIRRCSRAICRNERYRFTTWQLGRPLALLVALGALLKLAA